MSIYKKGQESALDINEGVREQTDFSNSKWIEIKSQDNIDSLLRDCNSFHDGIIRILNFNHNQSDTCNVIIDKLWTEKDNWNECFSIELQFINVIKFHMGLTDNYILIASVYFKDNNIIFVDDQLDETDEIEKCQFHEDFNYIIAKQLKWRKANK